MIKRFFLIVFMFLITNLSYSNSSCCKFYKKLFRLDPIATKNAFRELTGVYYIYNNTENYKFRCKKIIVGELIFYFKNQEYDMKVVNEAQVKNIKNILVLGFYSKDNKNISLGFWNSNYNSSISIKLEIQKKFLNLINYKSGQF